MHNKKLRKNKTKYSRKYKKTRQNKIKYSRKKSRKYSRKIQKGGRFLTYGDVDRNDICGICNIKFYDTPDKAIYKTNCNHLFHNDCLNKLCEENNGELMCPTCQQDNIDCMSIWAFKNKRLGNINGERPDGLESDEIFEVYNEETGVPKNKKRS